MSTTETVMHYLAGRHSYRRSRFHDKLGQAVPWRRLLRHAPHSLWTTLWAKLGRPPAWPWLPIEARRRIDRLLPGAVCLEYGSGLSTLWLAGRCRRLYSVESDPVWYERIERALRRRGYRHVTYRLCPEQAAYAAFPDGETDELFDFVLVDGFERAETLRQGLARLKPGGWLFLDDTDRLYDAGNAAAGQALLEHVRRCGGDLTWLTDLVAHEFLVRQGVLYGNSGQAAPAMQTKAPMMNWSTDQPLQPVTVAYYQLHHAKQLYRQGWLRAGVEPALCESVADHSHGVALLCWLLLGLPEYRHLDPLRVVALAALHDAGEVYAGDLTPAHRVEPAEKEQRERLAVRQVFGALDGGERYVTLWDEYAAQQTPEARFVSQVDRLELALQAAVYRQLGVNVNEFLASARESVSDPPLRAILVDAERLAGGC